MVLKLKNTWLEEYASYYGIKAEIKASNGQIFELQFHTPESFELKENVLHAIYEQSRMIKNTDLLTEFVDRMVDLSSKLERPKGIDELENIP